MRTQFMNVRPFGKAGIIRYFRILFIPLCVSLFTDSHGQFIPSTNNINNIVNSNTGNVGIGNGVLDLTFIPAEKLHVKGNTLVQGTLKVNDGNQVTGRVFTCTGADGSGTWQALATPSFDWKISGNSDVTATNFLGTTNAQPLIFKTSNAERIRILSNGRTGIGTASPGAFVHITAGNNTGLQIETSHTNDYAYNCLAIVNKNLTKAFTVQNTTTITEPFIVYGDGTTNLGRLGIGADIVAYSTSDQAVCGGNFRIGNVTNVAGAAGYGNMATFSGGSKLTGGVDSENNDPLWIARYNTLFNQTELRVNVGDVADVNDKFSVGWTSGTTWTPNFTVLSDGKVGIGTAAPTQKLMVAGNVTPSADNIYTCGASGLRWSAVWAANGTIQTSDERLKINIKEMSYGLNEVMKLKPISFNWKDKPSEITKLGFSAQQVKEVMKEIVIEAEDGAIGMYYSDIIPVLVKAIQEQQAEINTQKESLTNLNSRIEKLEQLLNTSGSANTENNSTISVSLTNQAWLEQNSPNPFTERTNIRYFVPAEAKDASIVIYNIKGEKIRQLTIEQRGGGELPIEGGSLAAGTYLYQLLINDEIADIKKMVLLK